MRYSSNIHRSYQLFLYLSDSQVADGVDAASTEFYDSTEVAKEVQMGMLTSNVLTLVASRCDEDNQPGEIADAADSLVFVNRAAGDVAHRSDGAPNRAQVVQIDSAENLRIKALECELAHLRGTLDQMVRKKTEQLERRLAIMESCNSTLGENYHRMHRMYLDLLNKTQA